ncbi:MAG TPA: lamin tail domain-containing protein, partial [Bacteroidia bacterium]|nr:lamin tail domain-containing protein [Bacteroidia bacterium]
MKKLFLILLILNEINHASAVGSYAQLPKQESLLKPLQTNVVINEIMADVNPSPSNLPAYEYIELYNRSSSPITLHKWTL